MLTTIIDWISNNLIALGVGAGGGIVAWPQVQALWSKITTTVAADVTAIKSQIGQLTETDFNALKTQMSQLQTDVAALKSPPKAS